MKKMWALVGLLPAVAFAASPFDGTWKTRVDSIKFSGKPDSFEVKDGVFNCKSCAPPYSIKADGSLQKTPENPYRDHASFKITGPAGAEWTVQKAGKTLDVTKLEVSADGQTLMVTDISYAGASPVTTKTTQKRVGKAAPGSHSITGEWQTDRTTDVSAAGLVGKLTSIANGLRMEFNGQSVEAKFDGKEYLTENDPGHTMVSLKRLSDREIEETDRRDGKVTDVIHWSVAADGKSLSFSDDDRIHDTKISFIMERQP